MITPAKIEEMRQRATELRNARELRRIKRIEAMQEHNT